MKWASMGRWPDAGFDGKPFATGSARAKMCGKPLADGFRYLGSQGKLFLQLNGFLPVVFGVCQTQISYVSSSSRRLHYISICQYDLPICLIVLFFMYFYFSLSIYVLVKSIFLLILIFLDLS